MPGREQPLAARGRLRLLLVVLMVPIVAAYGIMARFSLNIPFIDDYPTILGFAVRYQALPGFGARVHFILADQYTEYKLVFIDTFTALQLAAVHHVSFTFDFWFGQLALLGLLVLFWKSYFTQEPDLLRRLLLFTPMVLLLFGLNYAEALDWVACCIGYLVTILLSLVSLHLLATPSIAPRRWVFACAAACALLACSISANAFLLLPLGSLALLARRAFVRAVLWSLCFVLALVPYFVHYAVEMHSGSGSRMLIPLFFLGFLGSAAPVARAAIPLGAFVLVTWLVAVYSRFYRTHASAMLGVTWLLGSAALAAIGRGRTGLSFSTVSRYQIYSDLFLIFCYGYLAHRIATSSLQARTRHRLYMAALVCSALFWLRADLVGYRILRARHGMVAAAFHAYHADPEHNSPMSFNDPVADRFFALYELRARETTNAAVAQGLYQPPR